MTHEERLAREKRLAKNARTLEAWILKCPLCHGVGGWNTPLVFDECWACSGARLQMKINYGVDARKLPRHNP
jgi:hypothetical protein